MIGAREHPQIAHDRRDRVRSSAQIVEQTAGVATHPILRRRQRGELLQRRLGQRRAAARRARDLPGRVERRHHVAPRRVDRQHHRGQRVVDLVADAGDQRAERGQLLGVREGVVQALALGPHARACLGAIEQRAERAGVEAVQHDGLVRAADQGCEHRGLAVDHRGQWSGTDARATLGDRVLHVTAERFVGHAAQGRPGQLVRGGLQAAQRGGALDQNARARACHSCAHRRARLSPGRSAGGRAEASYLDQGRRAREAGALRVERDQRA